jgi:hypothetical protein
VLLSRVCRRLGDLEGAKNALGDLQGSKSNIYLAEVTAGLLAPDSGWKAKVLSLVLTDQADGAPGIIDRPPAVREPE